MMPWLASLVGTVVVLAGLPAGAGCEVRPAAALVCTLPLNAARAWQLFGSDPSAMNEDYVRERARAAGCAPLGAFTDFKGVPIKRLRSGRIATLNGWVGVTELVLQNPKFGDAYTLDVWVADAYLVGDCPSAWPLDEQGEPKRE